MIPGPAAYRRIRDATGLSQERFGRAIGASRGAVHHWEHASAKPSGTMLAIYRLLDLAITRPRNIQPIMAMADSWGTPYLLYQIGRLAFEG